MYFLKYFPTISPIHILIFWILTQIFYKTQKNKHFDAIERTRTKQEKPENLLYKYAQNRNRQSLSTNYWNITLTLCDVSPLTFKVLTFIRVKNYFFLILFPFPGVIFHPLFFFFCCNELEYKDLQLYYILHQFE